jgi:hypothetical protein
MGSRKFFILFLSTILVRAAIGQVTLDLQSKSHFVLQVNGHVINQHPCERLVFDAVLTDGKCLLKTSLIGGEAFEQQLTLKNGFKIDYQLGKDKKDKWKWMLIGETAISIDTTNINQIPSLESIYAGDRKCDLPVKEEEVEKWISDLKEVHRAEERLNRLKMSTNGRCLQVESVIQLLAQLELEDDQLSLLAACVSKIYDWDERKKIVEVFITERAQSKASQLLK